MKNNRQSNIELLRIISMLLIVIHHYALHTGFPITESGITFNKVFVQILSIGGKIGVNIFVLISGYFLIKSEFKVKNL